MSSSLAILAALIVGGACAVTPQPPPVAGPNLVAQFSGATSPYVQFDIAMKIVQAGNSGVLKDLEPWLAVDDRHMRGNAAFVFASFGDPRGFETIRDMLTDRSYRGLGSGIPGGSFNIQAKDWWLTSQIMADRYYAVHLLGVLKDRQAVDWLAPLLNDPDINYHVAWALGEIGDRRAIAPLTEALKSGGAQMREPVASALAKLGHVSPIQK